MDVSPYIIWFLCLFAMLVEFGLAKKGDTPCEVCVSFVNTLLKRLDEKGIDRTKQEKVEKEVLTLCKEYKAPAKEEKICYYLGAMPTSATYTVRELTKPLAMFMPPEKVCEKLKAKDAQICDIKFDREIDWATVDLNKLRVKELKKILEKWGETCKACTEKSEFVRRIQELKPKYVKEEL